MRGHLEKAYDPVGRDGGSRTSILWRLVNQYFFNRRKSKYVQQGSKVFVGTYENSEKTPT
jgi:hypothetical protein